MARRHHDPVVVRAARSRAAPRSVPDERPGATEGVAPAVPAAVVPAAVVPAAVVPAAAVAPAVPSAAVLDDPADPVPRDFVWRGRRYTVCAVLASWQERRAWWREVGDDPSGPPSPQRRVWRVEARPPVGDAGVFDLGRDDDHWLLLRAHD